jgi:hypothetical protein
MDDLLAGFGAGVDGQERTSIERRRVVVPAGVERTVFDVNGPGVIRNLWMPTDGAHQLRLRVWWDHDDTPAIDCPVTDFFAAGYGAGGLFESIPVSVSPGAMTCWWRMPFVNGARITIANDGPFDVATTVRMSLATGAAAAGVQHIGRFHAIWRHADPTGPGEEMIACSLAGRGSVAGWTARWGANSIEWWADGDVTVDVDGHEQHVGTIAEYVGGAGQWAVRGRTAPFAGPHAGVPLAKHLRAHRQRQFVLYRWHLADPIVFDERVEMRIETVATRHNGDRAVLQDDVASTVFVYLQPGT